MNDKNSTLPKHASGNVKNNNILTRFFSHNITLMILSFVLAFVIWYIINVNSETDSSVTISNIPVSIELSETAQQEGLEVFGADDLKASVEVSGNRVTVGSLSSDDILVYATQTGSIITPGTYPLSLSAKKTGIKNNYEIVSAVTPSSVTVRVDRRSEVELPIENRISVKDVDSQHYANVTLTPSAVHISGPESQVSRIATAVVFDSITAKSTVKKVKLLDSDGNELNLPLVTTDIDEVEVSVIVQPVKEVGLSLSTVGAPQTMPRFSLNPATVKVTGSQESLDNISDNKIKIGPLDFSTLRNEKYQLSLSLSAPEGCRIISVDSKTKDLKAEASIDLTSYSSKTVACTITASAKGDDDDAAAADPISAYDVKFDSGTIYVEIYGPASALESLDGTKLKAVANFENYLDDVNGDDLLYVPAAPISISFVGKGFEECWVYGTYTAAGNISRK